MASWQRSPRGVVLLVFIIGACLYFFVPLTEEGGLERGGLGVWQKGYDHSLESKLQRSDAIYQKMLLDRQGLIKKFGPTPKEIDTFPPNVQPWPPYTVWDFFPPTFNCPHEMQRIGALGDGGKWVCGLSRLEKKPDCVIYSFGINLESSFEAGILENTNHCEVWGYDFSVNSFGPEIPQSLAHRTHFHAYGLAGADKTGPEEPHKMYTLDSLMKQNGHTHIDILKVDIEGYEFETLTTLVKSYVDAGKPLPFGQLQLEIHLWNKSFEEFLKWWEALEAAGLRPFMTEPNMVYQNYNRQSGSDLAEYSFLNRKGKNAFTVDMPFHRHGA